VSDILKEFDDDDEELKDEQLPPVTSN